MKRIKGRGWVVIGIMITSKEAEEMNLLLKAELDELLFEMERRRGREVVRKSMEERYRILCGLFDRIASEADKIKYQRALKMLK
jgi:heme O synthase-like polyprenyltransferase